MALLKRSIATVMLAMIGSLGWMLPSALPAAAPTSTPTEDQVKAVFLFNFSQFVDWPATAFESPQAPFVIAVVDRDAIAGELEGIVGGERIKGHPLEVRRFHEVQDVHAAHILFAGEPKAAGAATLTVSDVERAAERGAMVQLARVQNRIRLRINVDAARGAGLTLSSSLLRPAEIVKGKGT